MLRRDPAISLRQMRDLAPEAVALMQEKSPEPKILRDPKEI